MFRSGSFSLCCNPKFPPSNYNFSQPRVCFILSVFFLDPLKTPLWKAGRHRMWLKLTTTTSWLLYLWTHTHSFSHTHMHTCFLPSWPAASEPPLSNSRVGLNDEWVQMCSRLLSLSLATAASAPASTLLMLCLTIVTIVIATQKTSELQQLAHSTKGEIGCISGCVSLLW